MRSFQMMGVACPSPGMGTFQRTFFVSLHSEGGSESGAAPVPRGRRNDGQPTTRAWAASAATGTNTGAREGSAACMPVQTQTRVILLRVIIDDSTLSIRGGQRYHAAAPS